MLVVFLMARVTVDRRFPIAIIPMAVLAWDLHMLVPKLVASLVVVEPDLFPVPIRVTAGASGTHLPCMLVIFLVAGVTI